MTNQIDSSSQEIARIIEEKKVSSSELADALNKTGHVPNVSAISDKFHRSGLIYPVFCANCSNYELLDQLQEVPSGSICMVFTHKCKDIAVLGYLNCKYLFDIKNIKALIVDGYLRDKDEIIRSKYPIWTSGYSPIGCKNTPAEKFPKEIKDDINRKYLNSPVVCDSTGVVAIPAWDAKDTEQIKSSISFIYHKEIVWSYCINVMGWSTFKTVCKKDYMTDGDGLFIDKVNPEFAISLKEVRSRM